MFFLQNSLKETIKVGHDWMIHTSPWADIMNNPEWPGDILDKHNQSGSKENKEDISDDGMSYTGESDDEVEFLMLDVNREEDEVSSLVDMME